MLIILKRQGQSHVVSVLLLLRDINASLEIISFFFTDVTCLMPLWYWCHASRWHATIFL